MSRLIVKNLPKSVTEDKIRELFGEKGTVTDVQLKYTADGKFRQFAFVGYQKEEEAEEAINSLDKTFINTSRIRVEPCALLGDSNKPKAWSKYATDSSAYKKAHPELQVTTSTEPTKKEKKKKKKIDESAELLTKYKDDPLFEEFLQVHAPEEAQKMRSVAEEDVVQSKQNEDSAFESDADGDEKTNAEGEESQVKLADEAISDLDYMKKLIKKKEDNKQIKKPKEPKNLKLFTLKLRGLPYNCKKKDIKHFFKPVTPFTIRKPVKIPGIAYVGFKTEKHLKKALLKDKSFISGKQISVMEYSAKDDTTEANATDNAHRNKWRNQEEIIKNEEGIAESGKIFVRNLSYTIKEEDIEQLFSKYGPLAEVNLPVDSTTKKVKGFCTVTFVMPEHAVKSYSELDGSIFHGRMLHLLPGKTKDETNVEESLDDSSNYKKKKALKQKSEASSSHNWNALFLGHDAVAEVIADTYNTSKETVLGPHADGSAAVRLALGETQIVAQTRKYLEQEGVKLDAFSNGKSKRSKTVIIVKNLPSRTESKEIQQLFQPHGMLGRVILPPSGITALVEFLVPTEAKKAYTRLAYSKFKNMPLYLEWAPEDSLQEKVGPTPEKATTDESKPTMEVTDIKVEDVIEEEPEEDTTLFVKNLNFQTTDQDLRKHFECCGKIFSATVATKKDREHPDKKLSMGYGFVRFMHKSGSDKALKTLQQSMLDGKSLELKRSERTFSNEVKAVKKSSKLTKQTGTKILVRNVPFQANRKEILELFSTFGEIKALRLPKKISGDSHRGFAFIDFTTSGDAKNAFEALSQSTHLYGRRLVLEWASSEEGVDEIRKRTADHFRETDNAVKSKKSVFNIDEHV